MDRGKINGISMSYITVCLCLFFICLFVCPDQVDIEKINNELLDFQNKCRKLPKGLKEWQAFKDLTKKIDDFNAICPLLERMADKAMKERHWKRIEEITKHKFDIESEGFALRNVMEAPLLENMEDIEVNYF